MHNKEQQEPPKIKHLDNVVNSYSVWPSLPKYSSEHHYASSKNPESEGDYTAHSRFHSNAPETWVRPMQRVEQLPPEWIGKGVRGYCIPTMNTEVSYIRNNDPDPWRVNTHEYFHFNYLGGGDGSEGYVHF